MIVVFGSINTDLVIEVATLPRPGETVLAPDYRALPGGKGANQALVARRAGGEVALYGCVGHDPFVAIALELLDRDGVDLSGLARSDRGTGCAAVCVDPRGENQIVVASGANRDARMTTIPDTALGTSASPSLPDLIRQSMFAADTAGSVDPRIKSGGDEFGKLKRTHIIGKRSRTAHYIGKLDFPRDRGENWGPLGFQAVRQDLSNANLPPGADFD